MRLHVESTTASPPELGRASAAARVAVERDALAQLDRSAVVRDADERQLHEAKWVEREDDRRRARSRRG